MFVLHPLKELEDAVLHIRHEDTFLGSRVALPPANLLQHQLGEDGQGAELHRVCHLPPLEVVEGPAGTLHPEIHHPPGQLLPQGRHLEELFLLLYHLLDEAEVLYEDGVALLPGAGDDNLTVWGDSQGKPGELVGISRPSQLVHRVKENEQGTLLCSHLHKFLWADIQYRLMGLKGITFR